jgi:hypothetical protein
MNKISLSRKDLEAFASNDIGFYGLDITRISSIFIAQVIQMQSNRVINIHQMFDEVKYLEGLRSVSSTKKAEAFKRHPLKGLMKKHFTDASFIVKNLGAHFGYERGGNKKLDKMIKRVFEKNTSGNIDNEFIMHIAHESTMAAIDARAKENRVTGEWIVFQKFEGKNYYLTLAAHNEGDEKIFKRICDSYDIDFPFLRDNA